MRPHTSVRRVALAAAGVLVLAGVALAHDTWLAPNSGRVSVGTRVTFDLTSGGKFPQLDFAIEKARVKTANVRLAGATAPLTVGARGAHALRLSTTLQSAGIATAWVQLAPKTLNLADSLVDEYLGEIDAAPSARERYMSMKAPRRWRESYRKHAKTYVRVGDPKNDSSFRDPVGLGFEIVPLNDPTTLRAGDALSVRVLMSGKPLGGIAVGLMHDGKAVGKFEHTNADGVAKLALNSQGKWLVHITQLRPSTKPGLEWESDFSTLMLFVSPGGR